MGVLLCGVVGFTLVATGFDEKVSYVALDRIEAGLAAIALILSLAAIALVRLSAASVLYLVAAGAAALMLYAATHANDPEYELAAVGYLLYNPVIAAAGLLGLALSLAAGVAAASAHEGA